MTSKMTTICSDGMLHEMDLWTVVESSTLYSTRIKIKLFQINNTKLENNAEQNIEVSCFEPPVPKSKGLL